MNVSTLILFELLTSLQQATILSTVIRSFTTQILVWRLRRHEKGIPCDPPQAGKAEAAPQL